MNYYQILHDFPDRGRWYLGNVFDHSANQLDLSVLCGELPYDLGNPPRLPINGSRTAAPVRLPVRVMVSRPGPALDFTLTAPPEVVVVTTAVAELVASVAGADVQQLPVTIDNRTGSHQLLNVRGRADALDLQRSKVEWWPDRKDRKGRPVGPRGLFAVYELVIDPSRTAGQHLFRLKNWPVLIASQPLKDVLEKHAVSGIRFRPV